MDERHGGRSSALTVDHLIGRLDELGRAYAALQRAYVELQATARARQRAPLVDDLLADAPTPDLPGRAPEHGAVAMTPGHSGDMAR